MEKISIARYTSDSLDKWNQFVENSNNGTIFHRLDFLAYHGDKFKKNEHHLVFYKGDSIYGVLPLGIFNENGRTVAMSPFGASMGGIVYKKNLKLKYAIQMIELLVDYLIKLGNVDECLIIIPPMGYYNSYNNYMEFAMCSHGFVISNSEISHFVRTKSEKIEDNFESRARNSIRKAIKEGNKIKFNDKIEVLYPLIIEDKKRQQLQTKPTHSLQDLLYLEKIFPDRVFADIAYIKEIPVAGVVYFLVNKSCLLTFYLARATNYLNYNSMNLLIKERLLKAHKAGIKYLDFGCSSYKMQITNIGVAEFKESFGAAGYFKHTFILKLQRKLII